MQLRDAGELSLDDPLTAYLPESAHGADDRPHARALLRAPARAARRDLGDDEGAVAGGAADGHGRGGAGARPGHVVALLEPRLRAARRGRRPRARRHLGGGAAGADPRSARALADDARTSPSPLRAVTSSSPTRMPSALEPELDLGGAGALGKLWSTTGDLARWGAFLVAGDDRVLAAATLEEMSHVRAMVDHAGWTRRLGDGARALPPRRERLRRPRRRDAGAPGRARRRPEDEDRRGRAHEHGRGRGAGEARSRSRRRRDRRAASGGRSVAGRRAPPRPRSSRCSAAGGRRATRWCFSWRQGRLEAKLIGGAPGPRHLLS